MTVDDTKHWVLVNLNENDYGARVKGPQYCVKDDYQPNGTAKGHGYTPYAAWFSALTNAGFTKYLAHDVTLERLGVQAEPPNRPILA
jgi:hypothetical protein